jgi:hypothetical protein
MIRLPLAFYTYGAVVLALLGVVFWLSWTANSRERAIERAEAFEAQADLITGATQAVEHVLRTETIVQTQTAEATHAIVTSPGAETPLPDQLRDSWRAGIYGMREASPAGSDPGS